MDGLEAANGAPAASSSPADSVTTLPAAAPPAQAVTLEAIEAGIRWPDPASEPAFWERPPRTEPLRLGERGAPRALCMRRKVEACLQRQEARLRDPGAR